MSYLKRILAATAMIILTSPVLAAPLKFKNIDQPYDPVEEINSSALRFAFGSGVPPGTVVLAKFSDDIVGLFVKTNNFLTDQYEEIGHWDANGIVPSEICDNHPIVPGCNRPSLQSDLSGCNNGVETYFVSWYADSENPELVMAHDVQLDNQNHYYGGAVCFTFYNFGTYTVKARTMYETGISPWGQVSQRGRLCGGGINLPQPLSSPVDASESITEMLMSD